MKSKSKKTKSFIKRIVKENENIPNGGFPPINLCENNIIVEEQSGNREYSLPPQLTVSIKDILNKRKNTTPLFAI